MTGDEVKRKGNSGQILLIATFIMASLLLSSQMYIFEVGKSTTETELNSLENFVLAVKLGSKHVAIGSLANASNGGQISSFSLNLQKWSSLISNQFQFGKSSLYYTLSEAAPYTSGFWIYQGINGYGFSSAYANFTYRLSDREVTIDQNYFVNITTAIIIESTFQIISGNEKQINITVNVLNEMEPALAKQIRVYYERSGAWLIPDETNNYTILDYGTGSYLVSFVADIPSSSVAVSAQVIDQREIYSQANVTSTQI